MDRKNVLLLLGLMLIFGCCSFIPGVPQNVTIPSLPGNGSFAPALPGTQPEAEWTYIVHIAGDNNLEMAALADFYEMEMAGSTDKVNIIVQLDRSPGYDTSEGDWHGARRYLVVKGDGKSIQSPVLQDLGNVDSGDPDTITTFVNWAIDNYPAKKYAVVFWDHGGGWTGMSMDDTSNGSIDMPELRQILGAVNQKLGRKIDVVVYDMCLMGQYDVALETVGYADYMVASEEMVPGWSFNYTSVLGPLVANPTMSPRELAIAEVESFRDYYVNQEDATTMSALDLAKMPQLKTAFDNYALALKQHVEQYGWRDVAYMHQYADTYMLGTGQERLFSFADLYDMSDNAVAYNRPGENLAEAAIALQQAINQTVIDNYNHARHPRSHGISYYFQPSRQLYQGLGNMDAYPKTLAFNQPAWHDFLAAYYAKENISGTPVDVYDFKVSASASVARPVRFSYTILGSNIDKNQWFQLYQQGSDWYLDRQINQRAATTLPNGKIVYGLPDGLSQGRGRSLPIYHTVDDGTRSVRVSADERWPAEDSIVVNGKWVLPTGETFDQAQLFFSNQYGYATHLMVTYVGPDGKPVPGMLGLVSGGRFTPYVYKLTQNGVAPEPAGQTLIYDENIGFQLGWHALPAGTYMAADMITTLDQKGDMVTGSYRVDRQPALAAPTQAEMTRDWECGIIEQGLIVQRYLLFDLRNNNCAFQDAEGNSTCLAFYSTAGDAHLFLTVPERRATYKFLVSRRDANSMWLFPSSATEPVLCVIRGSGQPPVSAYRELYASVGDNGADLDELETNMNNLAASWESDENRMSLKLEANKAFDWVIGGTHIRGTYSTTSDGYLVLNATAPAADYSASFYFLLGKHKLVLYDDAGTALVFNRQGQALGTASNEPVATAAPGQSGTGTQTGGSQPGGQQPGTTQPYVPTSGGASNSLAGTWANAAEQRLLVLDAAGYYSWWEGYYYFAGMWAADASVIQFEYLGSVVQYNYRLSGNTLTLTGQGGSVSLERQ